MKTALSQLINNKINSFIPLHFKFFDFSVFSLTLKIEIHVFKA